MCRTNISAHCKKLRIIFSRSVCRFADFFAVVKDPRPNGKAVVKIHAQVIDLLRACEKTRKKASGHALQQQHLSCSSMKVLFTLCEKINGVSDYFHCLI